MSGACPYQDDAEARDSIVLTCIPFSQAQMLNRVRILQDEVLKIVLLISRMGNHLVFNFFVKISVHISRPG